MRVSVPITILSAALFAACSAGVEPVGVTRSALTEDDCYGWVNETDLQPVYGLARLPRVANFLSITNPVDYDYCFPAVWVDDHVNVKYGRTFLEKEQNRAMVQLASMADAE